VGTGDTHISIWYPQNNYDMYPRVNIRTGVQNGLIRFELPTDIPPDAGVHQATLSLKLSLDPTYHTVPMTLRIYRVLRQWEPREATWNVAAGSMNWGSPGANKVGVDREATPVDEIEVSLETEWAEFDVTEAVQHWVNSPDENFGLVITGYCTAGLEYRFYSSEYQWDNSWHPILTITYEEQPHRDQHAYGYLYNDSDANRHTNQTNRDRHTDGYRNKDRYTQPDSNSDA